MGKRDKSGKVSGKELVHEYRDLGVNEYSQSKVKLYRQCKAAYSYRYADKLEAKKKTRPLMFGTIIHSILEHGLKKMEDVLAEYAETYDHLFIEEQEYYGDIINDAADIMRDYFAVYKDDELEPYEIKGISREVELKVRLPKGGIFTFKADRFVKRKGKIYLVEQKTFRRLPDENHRWRNLQIAVYLQALELLGHEIDGIMWDYICSKPPSHPQVLKNGKSCSTRPIVTLPSTLKRLTNNGYPKIHDVVWEMAEKARERYFVRMFYPVNRKVRKALFNGLVDTVEEMKQFPDSRTMNIAFHCNNCEYEPLCRARLGGLDEDEIKEKLFQKRGSAKEKVIEYDDFGE